MEFKIKNILQTSLVLTGRWGEGALGAGWLLGAAALPWVCLQAAAPSPEEGPGQPCESEPALTPRVDLAFPPVPGSDGWQGCGQH